MKRRVVCWDLDAVWSDGAGYCRLPSSIINPIPPQCNTSILPGTMLIRTNNWWLLTPITACAALQGKNTALIGLGQFNLFEEKKFSL